METFFSGKFCLPKCDLICASCVTVYGEASSHASWGQGLKLWLSCIWWASCNKLLVNCKCCYCSQLLLSLIVYKIGMIFLWHKMGTKAQNLWSTKFGAYFCLCFLTHALATSYTELLAPKTSFRPCAQGRRAESQQWIVSHVASW